MQTTIDMAGRLVIPKALRDELGLVPGTVEVTADGSSLRITPVVNDSVIDEHGRTLISAPGAEIDDALVRALLENGRR